LRGEAPLVPEQNLRFALKAQLLSAQCEALLLSEAKVVNAPMSELVREEDMLRSNHGASLRLEQYSLRNEGYIVRT
jgi:hypothetical protein